MRLSSVRLLLVACGVCWCVDAQAQGLTPGPPGPYVVDLRGVSAGVPNDPSFYPTLLSDSAVPARGFGAGGGVHVYPLTWGPSRVGIGADVLYARGSVSGTGVSTVVKGLAPQVSFNFGDRDGWSYLSAGYGIMSVRANAPLVQAGGEPGSPTGGQPPSVTTTGGTAESGSLGTLNVGGGARWFLSPHVAIGFDLRLYRVGAGSSTPATPATMLFGASAGVSLR